MSGDAGGTQRAPPAGLRRNAFWLGLAIVVLSIGLLLLKRDFWFAYDTWALMRRDLGDVESLLGAHAGHPMVVPMVILGVLEMIAGLDFYPWFALPTAVLWAVLVWLWTRYLAGLGATWPTQALFVVLMMTLGILAHTWIVYPLLDIVLIGSAWWLLGKAGDTLKHGVLLALGLLVALSSSAAGVAVAGSLLLTWLIFDRRKALIPAFAIPLGLFAWWFVTYGGTGELSGRASFPTLQSLADGISGVPGWISTTSRVLFGSVPSQPLLEEAGLLGYLAPVLLVAAVVVLFGVVRLPLNRVECAVISFIAFFVALFVVFRGGRGGGDELQRMVVVHRTVQLLIPLLMSRLVRHLASGRDHPSRRATTVVAATTALVLIALNAPSLYAGLTDRNQEMREIRERVTAAGDFVRSGDAYMPFALVVGQLQARDVAAMVDSIPPFPYDEVTEVAIDTTMRTTLGRRPPQGWSALDCVDATRGTPAVFDMRMRDRVLRLHTTGKTAVDVRVSDDAVEGLETEQPIDFAIADGVTRWLRMTPDVDWTMIRVGSGIAEVCAGGAA